MVFNPILVVFLPLLYIFTSIFICMQFSISLSLLASLPDKINSIPALGSISPIVNAAVAYTSKAFGPLHKFTPQPTHVLLVAILVAFIVHQKK
mmetsp:Transcript_33737/g.60908  ORF Transcript_33737/g.60908 Transcript_33737/m.60908 type:complete len:93 (-) Transcript_33737:556-834(-)